MVEKILHNKLLFIIIFCLFGFLGTISLFPKIFGILSLVLPIVILITSNNKNEEALLLSSYIVGAEVFIRMIKGFVFYETGKYGVILFLLIGFFIGEFKQKFSIGYLFHLLLLLLGIVFTQVPEGGSIRNSIVFNLSGPIVLSISALYFYQRPIKKEQLFNALFFMLLPMFSMITYLYFRTPDLKEIVFGGAANFATSGGFGPNQVATAIGVGILILTIFILAKQKLSGYIFLDAVFLIYFIYRGLLTFSRGGIFTAIICLMFFSFFFLLYKKISLAVLFKYITTTTFFIVAIWVYTSNLTGGMIDNRYTGKNAAGIQKKDMSTGRIDVFQVQFFTFIENPLGIGVGNGKYERQKQIKKVTAASHNEVGRLLEEHGVIGVFLLLQLLLIPLLNYFNSNNYQKAFMLSFYFMWFLTISHSAMRIALPGFIYGLCLIIITDIDE